MPSQPLTASVTTSWAALPSQGASSFSILNNTGADLLVARTDQTAETDKINTIKDGQSAAYGVNRNTKEFSIKAAAGATGVQVIAEIHG